MSVSKSRISVLAPCSATFKPIRSPSGSIRSGYRRLYNHRSVKPTPNAQAKVAPTPVAWTTNCSQRPKPVPQLSGSPKRATARVPQMPAARCTGTAPTTSSSSSFSSSIVTPYMIAPAIQPMLTADSGVMMWAEAVIPTSPANEPFIIIRTSDRPVIHHPIISATIPPKAPETVVLTIMVGTSGVSPRVLPPLKPNQPNHKRNTPRVTIGMS